VIQDENKHNGNQKGTRKKERRGTKGKNMKAQKLYEKYFTQEELEVLKELGRI
jgi:hypothetical protein